MRRGRDLGERFFQRFSYYSSTDVLFNGTWPAQAHGQHKVTKGELHGVQRSHKIPIRSRRFHLVFQFVSELQSIGHASPALKSSSHPS